MRHLVNNTIRELKRLYVDSCYSSCIALLYHRVINLPIDSQLLCVTPENFYEQIMFLKKNFVLLDIDEFFEIKKSKGRRFPKKSVIITFDDGYQDNFHNALPILETLNAQALFYVCTGKVDSENELWWDELERILFCDTTPSILDIVVNGKKYVLHTKDMKEKKESYNTIYPEIKCSKNRNAILKSLREWAGQSETGRPTHFILNSRQIQKMAASKSAIIGAHTSSHPTLALLNYEEQKAEIIDSRIFLENVIKKKIDHFSYPYGGSLDYNQLSIDICRELEFKMVFSNYPGKIYHRTNNYQLPRFIVRNWTLMEFKKNIKSYLQYI